MHLGTIVGIVLAVLLVAAIILAGIYINGHPTSNAALFFIEVGAGSVRLQLHHPRPHQPFPSCSVPASLHLIPSPTPCQTPVST